MELQVLEQNIIVQAFAQPGGTDALFERIAQEARSFVPDVTTKKGRDAIGSLALKVSKSKTLAEKYAKDLVAEQKAQIKAVDDDRIQFCKKMDALRDEILAPRNAYEQAEKDRIAAHQEAIENIRSAAQYFINDNSEKLKQQLSWVEQVVVNEVFEEFEEQAKIAKFETIELLRTAISNKEKYEAEQAELERLRKAEQERQQREHEERIAREAAEKATREAEEKARFEAERVQREKLEAEQREARLKAEKEAAELRAQHAAQMERERIEREQKAKVEAEAKAEAERLANVEHMKRINNEALGALLLEVPGMTEELAKNVLRAIAKNQVPHVSIKY